MNPFDPLDPFKDKQQEKIADDNTNRDEIKYRHDMSGNEKLKNFDQKIYMFPESYNALRKELYEHWPNLWALVSWRMANKAEEFVEHMNEATGLRVVFDTEKVDYISRTFLDKLIEMRRSAGR